VTQSRLMSLVEAIANVAVGFGVAVATQIAAFPLFGLAVSLGDNLAIGCIFTVMSLIRGYLLRRLFERRHRRRRYARAEPGPGATVPP